MPDQTIPIITAICTLLTLTAITIWYVDRKKAAKKPQTQYEANYVRIHAYWVAKATELELVIPKNASTADIQVAVSTENRRLRAASTAKASR
jgi:hypothetical protein